jgi:SAM-dependent methyltransferase
MTDEFVVTHDHLADNIIEIYRKHAHEWAAARGSGPGVEQAWLERFAELLPHGASVLDIGCGFGAPIAKYFIENGFDVTGIDASPAMIAMCRERYPERQWIEADMRSLSLGKAFHGLLAWDSLFHLKHDDQRRMFAIFAEHAAPEALLMFTSGTVHGEAIGTLEGEPLYHASLATTEYRQLLNLYGFSVVSHVTDDPTCGGHTIWLAKRDT